MAYPLVLFIIKLVRIFLLILTLIYLLFGAAPVFAQSLVINEIMAHRAGSNNEWVEIYNPTTSTIDLTGWIIQEKEATSGDFTSYPLASTTISPNSFYVYEFSGFKLNDSGDTVNLLNPEGNLENTYSFDSASEGQTFARVPDGGSWIKEATPTKGGSNGDQSPTQTLTPTQTSTPTATPTPTTSQSQFTISNIPPQINSDQSFKVNVNLSLPSNPNTVYYIKGAFKKTGGARYFGLTKKDNNWVEYGDDNSDQYKITTDSSGNYSGDLEVKPDTLDKDYKGAGDYNFKVGRFPEGGDKWSNEVTLNIKDSSSPTNSSTPIPTKTPTKAPSPTPKLTSKSTPSLTKTASVAGTFTTVTPTSPETPTVTQNPPIKSENKMNFLTILGIIFIIAGLGASVFLYFKYKNL